MVRWNWILGIVLVVLGVVLLLGIVRVFWPVLLIAVGVLVVLGATWRKGEPVREQAAIALDGATEASVRIRHGAGRLLVGAGAAPANLVSGSFGGGLEADRRRDGSRLTVDMRVKNRDLSHVVLPWTRGTVGALDWDLVLNGSIPLSLEVETGASETRLSLTDLQVRDLRVSTSASSTTVDLPARAGMTRVRLESGAAAAKLRVPQGVAALVTVRAALAGIRVDESRFQKTGDTYRSPGWETAQNRVEILVETGVGSVEVS